MATGDQLENFVEMVEFDKKQYWLNKDSRIQIKVSVAYRNSYRVLRRAGGGGGTSCDAFKNSIVRSNYFGGIK